LPDSVEIGPNNIQQQQQQFRAREWEKASFLPPNTGFSCPKRVHIIHSNAGEVHIKEGNWGRGGPHRERRRKKIGPLRFKIRPSFPTWAAMASIEY